MPKKALTLSIVIPVYNEERYLKACLDSIAKQTVKPDEVIVVDNNSVDKTSNIARRYSFVKLVEEPCQGVVFARNTGFDNASGTIIGRIDGDTILPVDWVQTVKHLYRDAGSPDNYAATAPSIFRNRLRLFWYVMHRLTYFWPSYLILRHSTLLGSNMFITKNLWKSIRVEICSRTDIHEDMDLAYHVHQAGASIEFYSHLKASIEARKMVFRLLSYPRMMLKIKFISH